VAVLEGKDSHSPEWVASVGVRADPAHWVSGGARDRRNAFSRNRRPREEREELRYARLDGWLGHHCGAEFLVHLCDKVSWEGRWRHQEPHGFLPCGRECRLTVSIPPGVEQLLVAADDAYLEPRQLLESSQTEAEAPD